MDVVSACPLRVASLLWQPRPGAHALTVVCVATYTLAPGESPLAAEQAPASEVDLHWEEDEHRSVHLASDLAPHKPRADVIVVGHAHAPGGEAVHALLTRLIVGEVDKSIEVVGDRQITLEGELRGPARFVRMPLRWERAAGGPETVNPVGVRADATPDGRGNVALPNLQPPGTHVVSRGDYVGPVGYGAVAPWWPGRMTRLHRHGAGWDHRRFHERPLPADLDFGYFNAAPPDQQLAELRSNERIVLENLCAEHPRLITSLQSVVPQGVLEREGGGSEAVALRCDTLTIDTDRGRCTLVWRGAVSLRHAWERGRVIVSVAGSMGAAGAVGAPAITGKPATWAEADEDTAVREPPRAAATLPFVRSTGPSPMAMPVPMPVPAAGPVRARPKSNTLHLGPSGEAPPGAGGAMPAWLQARFGASASLQGPHAHTPFAPATPVPATPVPPVPPAGPPAPPMVTFGAPPPLRPVPSAETLVRPALPPAPVDPPRPPFVPPVPAPPLAVLGAPAATFAPVVAPPPPIAPSAVPAARPPPGAPPPVAVAATAAAPAPPFTTKDVPAPEKPATPQAPPAPPAPARASSKDAGLPLDEYPIGRCAAVAASMARRPAERAAILDVEGLAADRWAALERHWLDQIRAEAGRGRSAWLDAYDEAYVGRLEEERGPVLVAEYARLSVAIERGVEQKALGDLGLPRSALIRIKRVWLRRIAGDTGLAAELRAAVDAARED